MQLYAHDSSAGLMHALQAEKHKNYLCLECGQTVRLRSGAHRRRHFYHTQPNQACRLNAKSMNHLMLQDYLQAILPKGEVQLEHRFPSINRIADVAWLTQKIIFEVQCSPITAEEVSNRNADYASVGYQVVWLLHDARYNQSRLSAAEDALLTWPHYYTDMNAEGEGQIYDQFAVIAKGVRKERLERLPVDLSEPRRLKAKEKNHPSSDLPQFILNRMRAWPVHFPGDILDCYTEKSGNTELRLKDGCSELSAMEARWLQSEALDVLSLPIWDFLKIIYFQVLEKPYNAIFRLFLERAGK